MAKEKGLAPIVVIMPLVVVMIFVIAGLLAWQQYRTTPQQSEQVVCTMEAKQCADGSYVSRTGPNCEFATCPAPQPTGEMYTNTQYGFELSFPQDWAGYSVILQSWQGRNVATGKVQFEGPQIVIRNPNWTSEKPWQDIPVMVFTKEQWNLVVAEKLAVSAAPIGPSKIGENKNYLFALPPRWIGFTDALGQEMAQSIAYTFKAF